ncbi:MAG: diguanylate cyclase [Gammaproteobacteria bacterium]|nr:diguanylate cyclase [Gammaproteobacteria bacterium]
MHDATHMKGLFDDSGELRFTVYGDFNCPFSYALNEQLFALGLQQRVDFRMIQHAPRASSSHINLELIGTLTAEVAEVRRRSPSTEINVPTTRPNSAPAAILLYALNRIDPVGAARLRREIYRALWVDGRDISRADILAGLLLELELELPTHDDLGTDDLMAWQSEWSNNTEFERNLPVVISESGETLIGFPLELELRAFLESGSLVGEASTSEPRDLPKRQRILVLDDDPDSLRVVIEQMHDAQVEVADDLIGLIAHARNLGMPDLLMVNTGLVGQPGGRDWWRNLTNSDPDPAIPIVHILDTRTPETEAAAIEAGAVDVIARPFHPKLLRSRLISHLRARRARQQCNHVARVDALTSLCNRREFDARLRADWGRCARTGDPLALIMIDVDRLRAFNDSHGHLSGDQCLVKVAQRLGSCMQRPEDLVARFRGGSFVALLPGVGTEGALKVAQDCLQAVSAAMIPHPASPIAPYVTVALGIAAQVPSSDRQASLLIEQAEVALFQAKRSPRPRFCAFDRMG